jgi:Spy/CpxP family protein refolding chaperone
MPRSVRYLTLVLTLVAAPAIAQEPPDVQRLENLRFQRLQEALSLSEEQARSLRSAMDEIRDQSQGLRESERESMEQLREALQKDPVDESAVARALESLDERRAEADRLRAGQRKRLTELLGAEQRARFLLFNHHFDHRLRELIDRRRGPGVGPGHPSPPPGSRGEGWLERRLQGLPPAERRRAIERLRGDLDRLEDGLKAE